MRRRYCSTTSVMIAGVFVVLAAVAGFMVGLAPESAEAKYYTKTEGDDSVTILLNVAMPHYTVHFDANGAPSGSMNDQDFEYNTAQELTPNGFRWVDHTFLGWSTNADGSGTRYRNKQEVLNLVPLPGTGTVTLYARWESGLHTVFEQDGACTFGGANGITGEECADFIGQTYIDTGVELYDEEHYDTDYEIGFKIVYYNPANNVNVNQATFVNSKWERGENTNNPGLVIRKSGADKIEFTQMIDGVKAVRYQNVSGVVENMDIVVTRIDGVVYYSVNGGNRQLLQSMVGTNDYIPEEILITTWFGAANDGSGNPMRVLVGTLSNMYVKIGDPKVRFRVDFDAQGGVVNPTYKEVYEMRRIGDLPEITWTDTSDMHYFAGWFTEPGGQGQRINANTLVDSDMTVYAFWSDNNNVCELNGVGYRTVQSCVNAAGTTPSTVTITKDTTEYVKVAQGQDITFDLGNYIMGDKSGVDGAVIENSGITRISNGLFSSSQKKTAVINNKPTGWLYVSGDAQVVATGLRQAIYNDGGHVEISGNAYLSAITSERAAVQNLSNGTMTILGGTIISENQNGVLNDSGTLVIGAEDGEVDSGTPMIRGASYGVMTTPNISFYDGVLMGRAGAINNENKITVIESGATPIHDEVTIDDSTYSVLYYTK